jgi:hypothetical protein
MEGELQQVAALVELAAVDVQRLGKSRRHSPRRR